MLSEILEIPSVIANTIEDGKKFVSEISRIIEGSDFVYLTGSGSSFHASLIMEMYLLKRGKPCIGVRSTEFEHLVPESRCETYSAIIYSQSGESIDAINTLDVTVNKQFRTIGITNEKRSRLASKSSVSFITSADTEKAVAATKSFIAQLVANVLIYDDLFGENHIDDLLKVAKWASSVDSIVEKISPYLSIIKDHVVLLGEGYLNAIAQEGALKLRETGEIITEAYPAREYLHGFMQTLSVDSTIIILAQESLDDSFLYKLKRYSKNIIILGGVSGKDFDIPILSDLVRPIPLAIILQIIAYYTAKARGLDPDRPAKLTKVVRD